MRELEVEVAKQKRAAAAALSERQELLATVEPLLSRPMAANAEAQTENLISEGLAAVAHIGSPVAPKGYGRSADTVLPAQVSPRRRRLSEVERRTSEASQRTKLKERETDTPVATYQRKAEHWAKRSNLAHEELEREVRVHPWASYASLRRTAKQEYTARETRKIAFDMLLNVVVPNVERERLLRRPRPPPLDGGGAPSPRRS